MSTRIEKVVKKYSLRDQNALRDDQAYWLAKTPEERLAAVDALRNQYYGYTPRLQRVARVIKRQPR